jgi:MtrB/PioB family decaheme-associated outer membrane protein
MRLILIPLVIANLVFASAAAGDDGLLHWTGYIDAGAMGVDQTTTNAAKFDEYRDLHPGVIDSLDANGESDHGYLDIYGENIGRDDQFLQLKGGQYGNYKFSIYADDIIHNLSFGAITPYSGAGSDSLTFPGGKATTNTALWEPFDYSIQRRNYGGNFDLSTNSPFYLSAKSEELNTSGVRPTGGAQSSPGGPSIELPTPTDYRTTQFSLEGGYATKQNLYSVTWSQSHFTDDYQSFTWQNPLITAGTNLDSTSLPADNDYSKIAAKAVFKQLPFKGMLSLQASYADLTSGQSIPTSFIALTGAAGTTGTTTASNPSSGIFQGDVHNSAASATYTAQFTQQFDSRFYWNYRQRNDDSTQVVFNTVAGACDPNGLTCTTRSIDYRTNNAGFDLGYRFNPENKLSGGFSALNTNRTEIDFDDIEDNTAYIEFKNSTFDFLDIKARYQRLERNSDFLLANDGVNPSDPNFLNRYVYRFDAAPLDQNLFKLSLDSSPTELLDLGGEFIFKDDNYKDTVLGLTSDTRNEYYLNATYGSPSSWRLTAFADLEYVRYDSTQRSINGVSGAGLCTAATPNCFNPYQMPVAGAYNWSGENDEENYAWGLGLDWPISDNLAFKGSYMWERNDGSEEFEAQNNFGSPLNIDDYDSYQQQSLNLKALYSFNRQLGLTLGFSHEDYHYQDPQINGYQNVLASGGTNYLTGAYSDPNYSANILYVTANYKFH